jgi:multidrug efflux pump subunit AcrA (membrane-fusion protein)
MKKDSKINKKYLVIGGVIILVILYFVFGRGRDKAGVYTIGRANISQSAVLSGTVKTTDKADLGFAASGRVAKIFVANNQKVSQGQILAQLEVGDLFADLKIKQLNGESSNIDLQDAKENLARITLQENTKVESTYRTLLTDGLEPIPDSDTFTVEAPIISGLYAGIEGTYKVIIFKENTTSSDVNISTFNLEKTKLILNETGPTPLGTRGLYISFPESDHDLYEDTTWYVNIPNQSSSSYLVNYNKYNEAKNTRDLAIKNAEFEYQKLLTKDGGGSGIAQAEIQKINAEIRKNTIYAPFSGKVTNIEKEVGESSTVGERVISILGEGALEVVLQVSELDVSRIGDKAQIEITLDAFLGETFTGKLKTINSRDTEIDGVSVYEAFVEIEPDGRIKTGMRATGKIEIASKENVLAVPNYFVKKTNGKNIVELVSPSGDTKETEVTLGLLGTDSMVEVTSGLNEGDVISSRQDERK